MNLVQLALCHNDVDNDCTFASALNGARLQSMFQNGVDLFFDQDQVLRDFLAETGWTGAPSADPGAYPAAVLDWMMRNGLNVGQQVPLVIGSASLLSVEDREGIAKAVGELGWAWVTLGLHAGDWGVPIDCSHQVILTNVAGLGNSDPLTFGTWDRWETESWAWASKRITAIRRVAFVLPAPAPKD